MERDARLRRAGRGMTTTRRSAPKFPLRLDRLEPRAKDGAVGARRMLRPQAPLQQAAVDEARRAVPSGLGLDSAEVRGHMVARLRSAGLRNEAVLAALAAVPRHLFVDGALVNQAYEDTSLPIGHGQTISKPSVVARMIDLLSEGQAARAAGTLGRVLEIGTGCGYQAALLARLARQVWSIERIRPLHDKARLHLTQMRETRVRLVYGDGMVGHVASAPYDCIVAAAGGNALPQAWLDQLAPGGRLVAPVSVEGRQQMLVVVDRTDNGLRRSVHETVHFVPLKAGLD
jgi:protein-L-isoaspartate(D-aspartate) O-methyltransferase